ncbi:MAG: cell division protein ZipA [Motiliproteus sp.]
MSLRDWLIVAGVVALIGILADGIRRTRNRNKLRFDIDKQFENLPEEDFHGELPSGGARVCASGQGSLSPGKQRISPATTITETTQPVPAESAAKDRDDIDLLLDAGLQGVGDGADRWLEGAAETVDRLDPLPSKQPVKDSGELPSDVELSVDPGDVTQEQEVTRVEPSISEIDLLEKTALIAESSQDSLADVAVMGTDAGSLDEGSWDGIVSPVRVRKLQQDVVPESAVSEPKPDTRAVDRPSLQEQQLTTATESHGLSQLANKDSRPKVALADEASLDLSQPVTVLLDQMKAQDHANESMGVGVEVDEPLEGQGENPTDELSMVAQPDPEQVAIEAELGALSSSFDEDEHGHQRSIDKTAVKPPVKKTAPKKSRMRRLRDEIQASFFDMDPELAPVPDIDLEAAASASQKKQSKRLAKKNAAKTEPAKPSATSSEEPEDSPVLVISVAGRQPLGGKVLFKLVEACGMEFSEMKIFHRYEDGPSQGAVQFSMANAIKPGCFNLDEKETFSTPAVTFFLEMSQPRDLMNAFECMLGTAQAVSENLDGVMKDENRSVLLSQTIEHYRGKIRDFERRRMAKRA